MDAGGIVRVCEALGIEYSRDYIGGNRGPHISIACPLAIKSHSDPFDDNFSCSVKINDTGPSVAKCHSIACGFEGSFLKLFEYAVSLRPKDTKLVRLMVWVAKKERNDWTARSSRTRSIVAKMSKVKTQVFDRVDPFIRDIIHESVLDQFSSAIGLEYVAKRGYSEDTIKRWGLLYDPKRKRLVFPCRRKDGKLIGLTGRDVTGESNTKWFNYSGLNKSRYLYGGHLLEPGKAISLCEGPGDALIVDQAMGGHVCAVACMGSGVTREHAEAIKNARPSEVYVFGDGDIAGRMMARKAVKKLKPLVIRVVQTPIEQDPGSLDDDTIRRLIASSPMVLKNIRWEFGLSGKKG